MRQLEQTRVQSSFYPLQFSLEAQREKKLRAPIRVTEKKLTFFQKIKFFFRAPIEFYYRKKRSQLSIAAASSLMHLLENKAYLRSSVFLGAQLNPSMKESFRQFYSVDYKSFSDKDVFGFAKLYLLKNLGCLVPKPVIGMIVSPAYSRSAIPRIVQEMHRSNSVYTVRIIQLLFHLMACAHRSFHINNVSELCLTHIFVRLFFGDAEIARLKKKSPEKYFILISRWGEILHYLPKGSMH